MNIKKWLKSLVFLLVVVVTAPNLSPASWQVYAPQVYAAEENSMAKIQLILKKLRASMSSMKDFDDLERAGMPKRNVDRLRRAMTQKIGQLTDEAVNSIHDL